ncbi:unnamed protein product [Strongylus vulgaris]|uniref:Uncharacterized protein n=1 Tax=Strongylus vulgaris TaxID=40348 RepID=A0A3P7KLR9_STRVU|nr:unnamed protein product [Strongylus vulgaris]
MHGEFAKRGLANVDHRPIKALRRLPIPVLVNATVIYRLLARGWVELQSTAEVRVHHARDPTVWLVELLGDFLIDIGQRLPVHAIGKEALHTGSHLRRCYQDQCQFAQDAMDFEPKGHVETRHVYCLILCTYNARTVSTNNLQATVAATGRVNYHLQETKSRKADVKQLS